MTICPLPKDLNLSEYNLEKINDCIYQVRGWLKEVYQVNVSQYCFQATHLKLSAILITAKE